MLWYKLNPLTADRMSFSTVDPPPKMRRTSKKVTRRNDTPKRKSILTRGKASKGRLAVHLLVVVGCLWIVVCLGVIAWYLRRRHPSLSSKEESAAMGVHHAASTLRGADNKWKAEMMNKLSFLKMRQQRQEEQETVPPAPQTGVKHIPNLLPLSQDPDAYRSPLVIFSCRRPRYLAQTLDDILQNIGDSCSFGCPVIVSEDGSHDTMLTIVKEYTNKFQAKGIPLIHLQHDQAEMPSITGKLRKKKSPVDSYRALSQHYAWALREVFNGLDPAIPSSPDRVIILEEDIHTAPDFFSYMKATSRILDEDSSLFAVSAYNDNGHKVQDAHRILRSDFFPGLGWMMTRKLWKEELESKWPLAYWDDWLREPAQRRGRHILRPEVSRTFHFGEKGGTSHNQFGSILSRVRLNTNIIDWSQQDLSYLHEQPFDEQYGKLLSEATVATTIDKALVQVQETNTRIEYTSLTEFKTYATRLDIMNDEKATIPRTAYKGVVECRPSGEQILFLTPPTDKLKEAFPTASLT